MKKKREIIAILLALVLFISASFFAADLLIPYRSSYGVNWDSFRKEPRNSLDVLFFGSSISYCDVIPAVIFDESKISSYVVAGPEQTIPISYYYIKEACKTQKPKAAVLELTGMFFKKYQDFTQANISFMPYNANRLGATFNAAEKERIPGLIFPILDYHDRWYKLSFTELKQNLIHKEDPLSGYTFLAEENPQSDYNLRSCADNECYNYALDYLKRICNYCEDNSIELLLYIAPSYTRIPEDKMSKLLCDLNKLHYKSFIDFNSTEIWSKLQLDSKSDWFDPMHFNVNGAEKFSRYFAGYLIDNGVSPSENTDAALWKSRLEHLKKDCS